MITFEKNGNSTVFVLFHGTGGDEQDLVPLASFIDSDASLVSLRGEVSEYGMLRFFRRLQPGVFDEESILSEAKKIHDFLQPKITVFEKVIFLGYSNGANMIGALMQLYPELVSHAILLHPMLALEKPFRLQASVIVTYGETDMMITPEQTKELIIRMKEGGVSVSEFSFNGGHEISHKELETVKEEYKKW